MKLQRNSNAEALSMFEAALGTQSIASLRCRVGLGEAMVKNGKIQEGVSTIETACEALRSILGEKHPDYLEAIEVLNVATQVRDWIKRHGQSSTASVTIPFSSLKGLVLVVRPGDDSGVDFWYRAGLVSSFRAANHELFERLGPTLGVPGIEVRKRIVPIDFGSEVSVAALEMIRSLSLGVHSAVLIQTGWVHTMSGGPGSPPMSEIAFAFSFAPNVGAESDVFLADLQTKVLPGDQINLPPTSIKILEHGQSIRVLTPHLIRSKALKKYEMGEYESATLLLSSLPRCGMGTLEHKDTAGPNRDYCSRFASGSRTYPSSLGRALQRQRLYPGQNAVDANRVTVVGR